MRRVLLLAIVSLLSFVSSFSSAQTVDRPLKPGGDVKPPRVLHSVDPEFPHDAFPHGARAVDVQVSLVVDKNGLPQKIDVVKSGGAEFDSSAIAAVEQYRFAPASLHGEPVAVKILVDLNYAVYSGKKRVLLAQGFATPILIKKVRPKYPRAWFTHKPPTGTVDVDLTVDKQGLPENVHVAHGINPALDQAAVQAVEQYRFKPGLRNGEPVNFDQHIEVKFKAGLF